MKEEKEVQTWRCSKLLHNTYEDVERIYIPHNPHSPYLLDLTQRGVPSERPTRPDHGVLLHDPGSAGGSGTIRVRLTVSFPTIGRYMTYCGVKEQGASISEWVVLMTNEACRVSPRRAEFPTNGDGKSSGRTGDKKSRPTAITSSMQIERGDQGRGVQHMVAGYII